MGGGGIARLSIRGPVWSIGGQIRMTEDRAELRRGSIGATDGNLFVPSAPDNQIGRRIYRGSVDARLGE